MSETMVVLQLCVYGKNNFSQGMSVLLYIVGVAEK